jgi:hypothetical protein
LVYRKENGRTEVFESAAAFIRQYNLSKKAVTVRLRNKKVEEVSDFYFAYLDDKETVSKLRKQIPGLEVS